MYIQIASSILQWMLSKRHTRVGKAKNLEKYTQYNTVYNMNERDFFIFCHFYYKSCYSLNNIFYAISYRRIIKNGENSTW